MGRGADRRTVRSTASITVLKSRLPKGMEVFISPWNPGLSQESGGDATLMGETGRQGFVSLGHVCERFYVSCKFAPAERHKGPTSGPAPTPQQPKLIHPQDKFPGGCGSGTVPSGEDGRHVRTCCSSRLLGHLQTEVSNTSLSSLLESTVPSHWQLQELLPTTLPFLHYPFFFFFPNVTKYMCFLCPLGVLIL